MARRQYDITVADLSGKRAVVTGASDGMGLGIATRLAGAGAEVVMPVRNPRKGEAAVAKIRESTRTAKLSLEALGPRRRWPRSRRSARSCVPREPRSTS